MDVVNIVVGGWIWYIDIFMLKWVILQAHKIDVALHLRVVERCIYINMKNIYMAKMIDHYDFQWLSYKLYSFDSR